MSFIDELNQANAERRSAAEQEITEKADAVMDYVKGEMLNRVNGSSGTLSEVTVRVMLRVSALCGAEYDIPDTAEGFERAFRLMGDALLGDLLGTLKAAGTYGAGVFEVRSEAVLSAVIGAVEDAAHAAGIQQVSVKRNEQNTSAALTFTAVLQ